MVGVWLWWSELTSRFFFLSFFLPFLLLLFQIIVGNGRLFKPNLLKTFTVRINSFLHKHRPFKVSLGPTVPDVAKLFASKAHSRRICIYITNTFARPALTFTHSRLGTKKRKREEKGGSHTRPTKEFNDLRECRGTGRLSF